MWSDRPKHSDPLDYSSHFQMNRNVSQKRKTKEEVGEGRRQEGVAEGGGAGLSSTGQKLMITLAST